MSSCVLQVVDIQELQDAFIMLEIPAHLMPVFMIAEKAADIIKKKSY